MPRGTHEQTINNALGEVLEELGQDWTVDSELIGRTFEDGGRPDILIQSLEGWPIVIEAEVGNHRQAEIEAQSRLGRRLAMVAASVDTAIALVYPAQIRIYTGQALRQALQTTIFEYAIFSSGLNPGETIRFPSMGWISGGLTSLVMLLHRCTVPAWRVEALADTLQYGVTRAEGTFSAAHPIGSPCGLRVAAVLGQSDDHAGQTRKMAMAVIVNALIFHEALAQAAIAVPGPVLGVDRPLRSPREFRERGNFLPTHLGDEWRSILDINYWPIFHSAGEILRSIPVQTTVRILNGLWECTGSA
jgi:hypothetical protein